MKEILKSIFKRTLFNILIFLQILFSILYFLVTIISIQAVVNSNIAVNNELDANPKKTIHMEIQNEDDENFSKFKNDLLNEGVVKNFSGWRNDFLSPDILNLVDSTDDIDSDIDSVVLTNGCEKLKKIKIKTGRYFTDADFKKENANGSKSKPFSILLGSEFANKQNLKVGDNYKDINDEYYKVVGILESDSKWFYQTVADGKVMIMDNAVMVAYVDNPDNPIMNYYSILNDNVNSDEAIYKINTIAKKYNIILNTDIISDKLDQQYDNSVSSNISWIILSIFIMAFVSVGTSILIISHMYKRKYEIGIRMAYGYSFKKILLLLWGEFFVVSLLAFLSALIYTIIYCSGGKRAMSSTYFISSYHLNGSVVLISIGIFLLMCLPSILALVFKLRKVQPKDLIGGK